MSIKFKLVVLYITLVFIVMIMSGTIIIVRIRENEISPWQKSLEQVTNITQEFLKGEERKDYSKIINNIYRPTEDTLEDGESSGSVFPDISREIEIFILSGNGSIITSPSGTDESINMRTVTPAMYGEKKSSYGSDTKTILADGSTKYWIDNARPVYNDKNEIDIIIYTRVDYKIVLDRLSLISDTIFIASITALLLTAVVGLFFANTLTAPIARLTKKSKELAEGNLYQEIPISNNDEIGQLTSSFNYMARELRHTFSNIQSEKSKLEILLHNMTDGVLAFEEEGKIVHANSLSQELLEVENIFDCNFKDIIKILDIDINDIDDLKHTDDDHTNIKEYTSLIGDKYINSIFSTYANDTGNISGVIIVLQDFTKYKKLDNMRKEFVANVSHEIRTPLTTIKGYTETLLDGALEDEEIATSFLKIIDSEANRMTLLAKDLLELSRFDNQQLKIELIDTNLISIIRETIIQNKLSAERKEQKIIFETDIEEANIKADRGRIIQVMTNIISNAIKYSKNGSYVEISIVDEKNNYIVEIKDNGMGIPQEDLERVFERFYRVDKARSRSMGGTGLGLAIAKEIMEAHGGKISMMSEQNVGTVVTLCFNKNFAFNNEV